MKKESVIYLIRNIVNNKVYVGSAVNFYNRKKQHIYSLDKNKHHSIILQRAWNKHGKNSFKFEIIEKVSDKRKLIEREQYYLGLYKSHNVNHGYNICKIAGSSLGVKLSKKTRLQMSCSHTGVKRGPHSDEAKKNISKGKLATDLRKASRKRKRTLLRKDKNIFKKIGKKSSITQIKNGLNKGANNPNVNLSDILIFNELGKLTYVTNNFSLVKFCKVNKLPIRALLKSRQTNGEYRLYLGQKPRNDDFLKYKGWFCKYKNNT